MMISSQFSKYDVRVNMCILLYCMVLYCVCIVSVYMGKYIQQRRKASNFPIYPSAACTMCVCVFAFFPAPLHFILGLVYLLGAIILLHSQSIGNLNFTYNRNVNMAHPFEIFFQPQVVHLTPVQIAKYLKFAIARYICMNID